MAELLNFVVWLPVAGMLVIALIPASQENMVRQVTLWLMILQFVLTAILYVNFDAAATGLQFETRVPWIESWGVNYHIGLDGINILLVMLTAFLGPLVVAGAFSAITKDVKLFYAMVFFIQFAMMGTFVAPTEADTFIAVAFPDRQLKILPYHRTVKDLNGMSPAAFLDALRATLPVADGGPAPASPTQVSMFLDGRWYVLTLPASPAGTSRADALAVAVLQREVLTPLLGMGDIRADKRIDFVGGARGTGALDAAVTSGKAAVAFSMNPVAVDDLLTVSDAGDIMPPKSTWFEPKLRDGLLVHRI